MRDRRGRQGHGTMGTEATEAGWGRETLGLTRGLRPPREAPARGRASCGGGATPGAGLGGISPEHVSAARDNPRSGVSSPAEAAVVIDPNGQRSRRSPPAARPPPPRRGAACAAPGPLSCSQRGSRADP